MRYRRPTTVLVGIAACAGLMLFAGCSKENSGGGDNAPAPSAAGKAPTTPAAGGRKKIVFVFKRGGISYSEVCKAGAQEANDDKALNADVSYEASVEGTPEKQADIINQAVVNKADAIVISAVDSKAVAQPIQNAVDAGVKVFTWDSDAPTSKRTFYVAAVDDVQIGTDIADALAKSMGEKGKVLIFSGDNTAENLNKHIEGIEIGLKKYPGIALAKPYYYNSDKADPKADAVQALQANPDATGIACTNSVSPRGAGEALRQLNLIGKVKVWGLGLPSEIKPYLKDGSVNGLYLWDPKELTYQTAKLVRAALDGKMPSNGDEIPGKGKIVVSGAIVTLPLRLEINKENVDSLNF